MSNSANPKIRIQKGGIETNLIPGSQTNTELDLPGYPGGSPENISGCTPPTDILRYKSIISISTSMVNNPSRMLEFLSPTFIFIQFKISFHRVCS